MRPFLISLLALAPLCASAEPPASQPVPAVVDPAVVKQDDVSAGAVAPVKQEPPQIPAAPKLDGPPFQAFTALGDWFGKLDVGTPDPDPGKNPGQTPTQSWFGKVTKIFTDTQRDAEKAKQTGGTAAGDTVVTSGMISVAEALTEPPPPNVPPQVVEVARVQAAAMLNRVGSEKDPRPFTSALGLSDQVLAQDPENRDALNTAAGAQYGLGRYPDAVRNASKIVEAHQDDERAYTTRALAYYQMKEYAQAYEDSQRALALNPNNETAFQVSKLAKPRITTASDLKLDAAQKHMAEQVAREYKGQLEESSRAQGALPSAPGRIAAPASSDKTVVELLRRSAEKVKMQDYRGAHEDAARALEREPGNPDALEARASAASLLGEYDEAAADASAALERDPARADALLTRAQAHSQRGRHELALVDADRAVALRPSDPYAYKARARAREGLGDLAGMLEDYRHAARMGPQFDQELRDVAARYGFSLDSGASPAGAPAAPAPRRGRFWLVLGSSVVGGLLVAWGLVQALLGGRRGAPAAKVAGASEETARALAAAGGLGAGYEVVRTLGQGGMGVVYEAMDKALERRVAVKKMRDEIRLDERERARFLQEARIVAQLHHPNIVEIHTIVSEGDDLYLVFEYVEGHTIDQIIARKGRLTIPEAQWVLHGVAKALEYAHARAVVHRDLKPSNIMMEKDGLVKVMDFGIARQAKDALAKSTMTGTVAGTPQYMAPEQEEGVVRPESDVFSLGAMLYEMVTGQRPYPAPATTASKVNKKYQKASRLLADLPPELEKLIDDCLEPDPERRPRTAAEFRKRLDALKPAAPAVKGA